MPKTFTYGSSATASYTFVKENGKVIEIIIIPTTARMQSESTYAGCPYCGSYEGDEHDCPECGHNEHNAVRNSAINALKYGG